LWQVAARSRRLGRNKFAARVGGLAALRASEQAAEHRWNYAMKLNLGCGHRRFPGFVNVDKYAALEPDQVWDLESVPYPFEMDSVDEVLLLHVLEHLGQGPDTFINIIKELYRICAHDAVIKIAVPHWRHDDFFSDPTHVRPITPLLLSLFDRELNLYWQKNGSANSPLALIHQVNFKIDNVTLTFDEPWFAMINQKAISKEKAMQSAHLYNNVVKQLDVQWRVLKR
jgi:SAM-dependent methyltransferase